MVICKFLSECSLFFHALFVIVYDEYEGDTDETVEDDECKVYLTYSFMLSILYM